MGFLDTEARIGRITASSISDIMYDKAPTETYYTLCMEKAYERLGIMSPPNFEGDAIVHGNENEPMALMFFEIETGLKVEKTGSESEFIKYQDFAGCTPDGLVGDKRGVEVKCPYNPAIFLKQPMLKKQEDLKKMGTVGKKYYWQCQSSLLFSNREAWDFVSFHPEFYKKHKFMGRLEILSVMEEWEQILTRLYEANNYINKVVERVLNKSTTKIIT